MLALVAIDPGQHRAGLALWLSRNDRDWALLGTMPGDPDSDQAMAEDALRDLMRLTACPLPDAVYILTETWTNPQNRRAVESLAHSRDMWEAAARRVFDATFYRINSQTWQGKAGLLSGVAKAIGGTKAASLARAKQALRIEPSTEDEADAANMGDIWLALGGPRFDAETRAAAAAKRAKAKSRGGWTPEAIEALKGRGILD